MRDKREDGKLWNKEVISKEYFRKQNLKAQRKAKAKAGGRIL